MHAKLVAALFVTSAIAAPPPSVPEVTNAACRLGSTFGHSDRLLIYHRTKNLRAVQLLLGHTKLESTVRYLGIEEHDALEMAEQTEV